MTVAEKGIIQRKIDYRDFRVFRKRRYRTSRRKPGCVWNWSGAVPWWGDSRKLIDCAENVKL